LKLRKVVLGGDDNDTLRAMMNLAGTYRDQGRLEDAADLMMEVSELRRKVLGKEHPDTLRTKMNLAVTYRLQGRREDAVELQEKVLRSMKRVLGDEHPDTLRGKASLAATYWNHGQWNAAAELDEKVLESSMRVLGEDHPDTLVTRVNLGNIYKHQGRMDDSIRLLEGGVEGMKRISHPNMLWAMECLAEAYTRERREPRTEDLHTTAESIIEPECEYLGPQAFVQEGVFHADDIAPQALNNTVSVTQAESSTVIHDIAASFSFNFRTGCFEILCV